MVKSLDKKRLGFIFPFPGVQNRNGMDALMKSKSELRKIPRLERLRRRAQAPLKPSAQAVLDSPDREAPILIHKMRLRLAELAMKNEELRRVQLDLENSRDRFARLYDLSPVGYLTLDADDVVCEANLTAARLLGLDRQVLLRKKMLRFIAPESQTGFCLHRRQFFSGAVAGKNRRGWFPTRSAFCAARSIGHESAQILSSTCEKPLLPKTGDLKICWGDTWMHGGTT